MIEQEENLESTIGEQSTTDDTQQTIFSWNNFDEWIALKNQENQISAKNQKMMKTENVEELDMEQAPIGDIGLKILVNIGFPKVQQAWLSNCQLSSKGIKALSKVRLPLLKILHLNKNQIADNGIVYLAQANWPQLEELGLENNSISNRGLQAFTKADWPMLKALCLKNNKIQDSGYCYLSAAEWFPKLIWLSIQGNNVRNEIKIAVRKRLQVKVRINIDELYSDEKINFLKNWRLQDKLTQINGKQEQGENINIQFQEGGKLNDFAQKSEFSKALKNIKPTPQTKLTKFINFGLIDYEKQFLSVKKSKIEKQNSHFLNQKRVNMKFGLKICL